MTKLRTSDKVMVISGKFKGTVADIEDINKAKTHVYLKGVNVVKKATKGKGFVEKTLPLHISNVMFYSEKHGKATRLGVVREKGKKLRVMKKFDEKL